MAHAIDTMDILVQAGYRVLEHCTFGFSAKAVRFPHSTCLEKGFILLAGPKEINGTKPARMLLTAWVSSCSRTVLDQPVTLFVLELNLSQQHGFQKLEHYLFAKMMALLLEECGNGLLISD
jgi:hypothetical protein